MGTITNKNIFLYFLVINVAYVIAESQIFTEDYCWRDYEGIIPSDALAGGLDRNGKPIYIGQAIFENKLIPGKIYENDNKQYFEWYAKEYSTNQNVKILCSHQQPQKFQWLHTRNDEVLKLTKTLLIRGGFEPNYATYIGRALTDGETSVGKVMCSTDNCLGLFTTDNGKTREHKVFEILSYNPQSQDKIDSTIIDVRTRAE